MAGGCELSVARQQPRIERLGQRHIRRIVGSELVPQLPDAWSGHGERMARDRKITHDCPRLFSRLCCDPTPPFQASQDAHHLDVEKLRGVEVGREDVGPPRSVGFPDQHLDDGRRIENGYGRHLCSSLRISSRVGALDLEMESRRAMSSSFDGRAATAVSSSTTYADRD